MPVYHSGTVHTLNTFTLPHVDFINFDLHLCSDHTFMWLRSVSTLDLNSLIGSTSTCIALAGVLRVHRGCSINYLLDSFLCLTFNINASFTLYHSQERSPQAGGVLRDFTRSNPVTVLAL